MTSGPLRPRPPALTRLDAIAGDLEALRERVEAVRARQAVNAADLARLRERVAEQLAATERFLGRPPRI